MIAERKRLIRQRARAARKGIPTDERELLSRAACERILDLVPSATGTVLGYAATAEEIDPARALAGLRARGWTIALPRISGPAALTLHETGVEPDTALERGPHGIMQPAQTAPALCPDSVSLVIAPGIAFDTAGRRLGYGGGYYDRLLMRMHEAQLVGIAFEGQMTEDVPTEEHDVHMHVIVTPSRTIRVR